MHGGSLSGSVGSEKAEDLAATYRERDVIDGMKRAEGFHQMRHLDDVILAFAYAFRLLQSGWVEHIGKLSQYVFGRVEAPYVSMVEKSHAVAAAYLVEIGRGSHDGDASLAKRTEHVPQLFTAHGVDTGGGFVEEEHAGLMHQGTREGELLLHSS